MEYGRISEVILNKKVSWFKLREGGRSTRCVASCCYRCIFKVVFNIASLSFSVFSSLKFVFKLSSRLLLCQHSDGPPPSLPRLDPYADERWSRLSGHSLHQSNHFDVRIYFASLHFHQTYAPDSLLTIFLRN